MERKSQHTSSSLDQPLLGKATGHSSDTSPHRASNRNLIAMGQNPRQWSEPAGTSEISHSNQEKQALLHEKQETYDRIQSKDILLTGIKITIINSYKDMPGTTRSTLRTAHNRIAEACLAKGQYEEALFSYEIAVALDSRTGQKGYDSCLSAAIDARKARYRREEQGVHQEEALLINIEKSIVEGYKKHHLKGDEDSEQIKGVINKTGEQYRETRQYKEALFFYNVALALKKDSKTALQGCGAIYREQGRLNEALADLNQAIKQFIVRPSTFALANRGATLLELGRFNEARADLERVLKRDQNNILALKTLKKLPPVSQ